MLRRIPSRLAIVAIVLSGFGPQSLPAQPSSDPLVAGFRDPPSGARPRVWWHWMNGNITREGIARDLDWMRRTGIGGVQNFDANFNTPQVVERRLDYMSPEWREAFRFAASRSEAEGLEMAIAGAPGWSETGGPWVAAEDGIKKLSWSETIVAGGRRFPGRLPLPPATVGAYQALRAEGAFGLAREGGAISEIYRDIAILAVPLAEETAAGDPVARDGQGQMVDAALLSDGDLEQAVDLGISSPAGPASITLVYPEAREMRSATLFMRDALPNFFNPDFSPVLEARVGGAWTRLATFELAPVPTTVAFAPVRAAEFRVLFGPFDGPPRPAQMAPAPGAIVPPFLTEPAEPRPVRVAELRLTPEARIDRFEAKAGFSLVNDYHALASSASPADRGPDPQRVIDLTGRLRPDGTLDWTPPRGTWRILRLGWTLTGKTNHPASPEATGLEVDKLDGQVVERYMRHYLDLYRGAAGADLIGARGVRALLLDSTEAGAFNWTPRMIEQFRRLRGYDPVPWLPAMTGMLIGSREQSDRFLYDLRRTISELHATEHYGTVARVAHEYGLIVYGEALEDQRPVLGDDLAMRRFADVPMAALWTWDDAHGPRPTLLGDMRGASSVAHLYGRNIVAAESMTSALSPWADSPAELRRVIDLEFAHGINRPVIHTSVHQPTEQAPGLSLLIFGQFFNRHESWAEMARPWIDYIARSAFLLQQGRNVADIAYFYGEESPLTAIYAFGAPSDLPSNYAFDYVNAEALSDVLRVESGDLVAASGARYHVLYLGANAGRMTLPTLRRIETLAREGATIVGLPPTASPSLADDPGEYARLVARLWPGAAEARIGLGRVVASRDVEAVLAAMGVPADVELDDPDLMFVHRKLDDGELYFIVNRSDRPQSLDARFRVSGRAPSIWSADTGAVTPASFRQEGGVTRVPLAVGPEESLFVLFREPAAGPMRVVDAPVLSPLLELSAPWRVRFQPDRGAPASAMLPVLRSLSELEEPGIRYFSGEATYTTRFTLPASAARGTSLWLELGSVGDIAEVRINGTPVGGAWHAPWRVEISPAVRPGPNLLEVKVANLWVNRLIGDAQPGATRVAFVTVPTFAADAPLRPSGLIGPVRILVSR